LFKGQAREAARRAALHLILYAQDTIRTKWPDLCAKNQLSRGWPAYASGATSGKGEAT
jgi:hypothetical protein